MTELAGFLITGLVSGALYSMMATGIVLTYSSSGIFNFAHGAIAFVLAFSFLELRGAAHLPSVLAAAICLLVIAPLLGLVLEVAVFRRLAAGTEQARIVGTVGLAIALPALVIWILTEILNVGHVNVLVGQGAIPLPLGPLPQERIHLFSTVSISSDQIIIFAFAALIAVSVWWVIRHTRIGLEMRAAVDARNLAEIRGVDLPRVSVVGCVMSAISAGMVGVSGGIILGLDNDAYTFLLFAAAAAAVIARYKSIPIAFAGGLAIGIVQDLVAGYLNFGVFAKINGLSSAVPFILLLLGLMLRSGPNATRTTRLAVRASDAPVELTMGRKTWGQRLPLLIAAAGAIIFTLFIADSFWAGIMAQGFVMSVIFLSFTVLTGVGGMVSLAQAGFVTASSLFAGWMYGSLGLPFGWAALIGIILAVVVGILVAVPALRLDGLALALSTFALAIILNEVIFQIPALGNIGEGWTLPKLSIGPLNLSGPRSYAVFALVIVAIIVIIIRNFERSASGRAMLAVRGSHPAAIASGVSQVRAKFITFAFASAIAGIGGILLQTLIGNVTPSANPPELGLLWVTIAITLGVRRPAGAIVAGVLSAVFPQLLDYVTTSQEIPAILFGFGAIALTRHPGGLLDLHLDQIKNASNAVVKRFSASRSRGAEPQIDTTPSPAVPLPIETRDLPIETRDEGPAVSPIAAQPTPAALPRDDESETILELRTVHAGYGPLEVLHGISLKLKAGSITALLGPNGAGKSTLAGVLAGTVPISSGSVLGGVGQIPLTSVRDRTRAGMFVAPETRGIFPGLTVEENLRLWLVGKDEISQAMDKFPILGERRLVAAGLLSGGEQQILTLAPAFVRRPTLLIADEPTLGLAPRTRLFVMELCEELRDSGVSILLIEEKARDVLPIADQTVVIQLGRIVLDGVRGEVNHEDVEEAYFGSGKMDLLTNNV